MQDFDEEQLKEIHMGRLIQVLSHQMKRKSCVNSMINDDGSDHHAETCVKISSSGNPSQGCLPERHRRRISDPQIHGDRNAAASRKKWFYCAGKRKKRCPSETHHSYKESGSTPSEHPCTHKAVGNTAYDRYFRS